VAVIYSGIETIKLIFPRNNADYCASTQMVQLFAGG